jgi:hypothetical protein
MKRLDSVAILVYNPMNDDAEVYFNADVWPDSFREEIYDSFRNEELRNSIDKKEIED